MTLEPSNSHVFFAYHLRSAGLIFEMALKDVLEKWNFGPQHFYILRCNWKPSDMALDDIIAHAMLNKEETVHAINDLVAKGYVIRGPKNGSYALSAQGVSVRDEVIAAYRTQISEATQGLSHEAIESTLSNLLTVQNNFHKI